MARTNHIIAIDGYSSCGKSTLAKALAKALHYVYIDSGAMYRAVTLYIIRHAIPLEDEEKVAEALRDIHIDFHPEGGSTRILLNGEDVSEEIRQMYVSDYVSEVSAIKAVRQAMVAQQQRMGQRRNIVMDGRDIGTTVFPDADLKIFMTADPKVRAERRYLELKNKGTEITLEEVFENLAHRDYIDTTREESPLIRAEDAIILDNTDLTEAEQLQFVLDGLPH
ncbi:(d)CMP kinase [Parapedobacter sp. DT-150]|uniref:(d)CMP kinase n=1 Tax=Parapedobacter sp. DT-150 TaxID=3396162 RepID=UPI003F1BE69A